MITDQHYKCTWFTTHEILLINYQQHSQRRHSARIHWLEVFTSRLSSTWLILKPFHVGFYDTPSTHTYCILQACTTALHDTA